MLLVPDDSHWFQRALQFAAVFFFVVLPIVRSIIAARKQQAAGKTTDSDADADDDEEEDERSETPEEAGRRRFEALLRGERPVPTPPAATVVPVSRVRTVSRASDSSREIAAPGRMVELETGLSPAETERDVARRELAEEESDRSLPAELARAEERELARQREVAAAEYAASSSQRAEVEPVPASAIDPAAPPPASRPGARERWIFPSTPATDRRATLQRAFVLQEVFARPVALREPSQRAPRSC